jgi:putative DNA methylase
MPLVRSWWLGKKKGKEAYVVPRVVNGLVEFSIGHDVKAAPTKENDGTVTRTGAVCVACDTPAPLSYVRAEGKAKRMGAQLMAIAAEGNRRRVYLPPTPEHEQAAAVPIPDDVPDTELPEAALGFRVQGYGMTRHADLFTPRQLTALTTFTNLVMEAHARALAGAVAAGHDAGEPLETGGTEALAYADAVAAYLALGLSRLTDYASTLTTWVSAPQMEILGHAFTKQTISMVWDYAEGNVFGASSGTLDILLAAIAKTLERLQPRRSGTVRQDDAARGDYSSVLVATDPPYYDNVGYSDLSDFFYVWLRQALISLFPSLLETVLTPKASELVADPFRRGGREGAGRYFEDGFLRVFGQIRIGVRSELPITLFYAFKQAETLEGRTASTGWEVLLGGLIRSGWEVTATWPMRTERSGRMRDIGANALASSVVLACRPRPQDAGAITLRGFLGALKGELPKALKELQQGSIPPVDLAQAAIGPGMAVFSRYAKVVEPDGSDMTVRTALTLMNAALDEVLSEQEGDFDTDTRFCVRWFRQFGWDEQPYGRADELSRATNTSVGGLERGGVFWARGSKARLLEPAELTASWDPAADERISVWEVVLRLAKALSESGVDEAARLMAASGGRVDLDAAKELAYLLFSICERQGWTQTALLFNGLGTSWSDLSAVARTGGALTPPPVQDELDYGAGEE